ncbi:AAA family ATPase [Candidatus Dependentiae bacterium]|nr:AAA family ATPase [Candidatus Dependentiae bacterium]
MDSISKTEINCATNLKPQIEEENYRWQGLKTEIKKRVIGQDEIVERIIIGLLCNGHILLEGVPGIAKTTLIKAITEIIGLSFKRIQFTPDLLPSDLIGTLIYNQKTESFQTKRGPIFANVILADEINRAPAKVQSALLEAMQEHQVTIGDETHLLEKPFLVLATQNPIEQEGTYHLPEAQVDRFMFKLLMKYPEYEEEKKVIETVFTPAMLQSLITSQDLANAQNIIKQIYIDEKIVNYILTLVFATRKPNPMIEYGASPRATLALHHAARAHAFLKKRHFVIPDDVKAVLTSVLRHRIILSYEAEAENISSDQIIQKILSLVPSP